ncbi:MAG: putative Transcription factor, MarR family [Hyphomicrobiales bacterium]|nr:putative Transcription factor, MarR family [Hyphomicrobiales bacterium]
MKDDAHHRAPVDHASDARVGHLLRRAYHKARENSARRLAVHDLTPRQAAAMWELRRAGSLSQAELGAAIGMEPANVHGLVERLRKKALVLSQRDGADPRRLRIGLTEAGAAIAAGLAQTARDAEREALARLSGAEQDTLVELLRKMLGPTAA